MWVWGDGVGVEGEEGGGGGWWGWVGWSGQEKVKIRDSNPQALDPCSLAARRPNRSPQFGSVRFGSRLSSVRFGSRQVNIPACSVVNVLVLHMK